MDTPTLGSRVRVLSRPDKVYIVVRVDEESRTVDLVSAGGFPRALDGVPILRVGEAGGRNDAGIPTEQEAAVRGVG